MTDPNNTTQPDKPAASAAADESAGANRPPTASAAADAAMPATGDSPDAPAEAEAEAEAPIGLHVEVRDTLSSTPADDWNALSLDGNPFVRHEFLLALEQTGCLGEKKGWYPRYFLIREAGADGRLLGACPCYIKTNSYGEFVFDWAWADAYERNGLPYYPKMVCAVPYTPATGPRLLVHPDCDFEQAAKVLAETTIEYAKDQDFSSVHWLFLPEQEHDVLTGQGLLARFDCQYHWHNDHYADFDDFLSRCTSKRRKTIRRERRHVTDAGLRLERRHGDSLSSEEWAAVYRFYRDTFDRKWGSATLTRGFFERMGETFGPQTVIVFAYADAASQEPIAAAIMFRGEDALYGRFWGCSEDHHSLHFEACYYQGIEYCIEHGLSLFEPGAQGEHKITRGFVPTMTRSAHWIADEQFRDAIDKYLLQETKHVRERCSELGNLLPFKHTE